MTTATKMSCVTCGALPTTRPRPVSLGTTVSTRKSVVCEAKPLESVTAAVVAASPALLMTAPAYGKVTDGLVSEGTGLILGITEPALGWSMLIVFGLVWALYATSAKTLGGGENDDSGMSL